MHEDYKIKFLKYVCFLGTLVAILAYPLDIVALKNNLGLLLILRGHLLLIYFAIFILIRFQKKIITKYFNFAIIYLGINICLVMGIIEGYSGNTLNTYYLGVLQVQLAFAILPRLNQKKSAIIILSTLLSYFIPTMLWYKIELGNIPFSLFVFSILLFMVTSKVTDYLDLLEEARDSQLRILSVVTHELRNPLQNISLASEILKRKLYEDVSIRKVLNILDNSIKLSAKLTQDILDASRLSLNFLTIDKKAFFDIEFLLEQEIENCDLLLKSKKLLIHYASKKIQYSVLGEPVRGVQVLINVISNAIKYTTSCDIYISVEQDQKNTYITIKNETNKHAKLEKLGETILTHNNYFKESNGLGFWISAKIMIAFGGNLSIRQEGNTIITIIKFVNSTLLK